jgi:hypothetical protein
MYCLQVQRCVCKPREIRYEGGSEVSQMRASGHVRGQQECPLRNAHYVMTNYSYCCANS